MRLLHVYALNVVFAVMQPSGKVKPMSLMCWGTSGAESLGCDVACLSFLGSGWSAGMRCVSAASTATMVLMHLLGYDRIHA